ncbi:glycosyltransferase [Scytonema millei]|uniref:Glycosyltransferase n=1 Tax=Scytonema millei VB511283 TaxID=1245923 RepID=A0A9X5E330_9CYAN|nr:glycosyltransferase [Scytonema millei]NHC34194.1 glycosyltransferase [Scytonema millei VB511283]
MRRIAFFVANLHGGGAERVAVNLLKGMSLRGIPLDLVMASAEGPYLNQVPQQVRIVDLAAGRTVKAILPLSRYLRQEKPLALLSHMNHVNVAAVVARELASTQTRLVLVEHDTLSVAKSKLLRGELVPPLMKLLYPRADAIVGVSNGAARDLEAQLGLAKGKVSVIYNPVVDDELLDKGKAALDHPWFQEGSPPVFLAVGRLTEQKDFFTLLEAFELVRRQRLVRLIILGEGDERDELEAAIARLGIAEDVSMPGFVENPYAYMSRASVLVLSSRWEGLGVVLIEAMACGCPAIATDCPNGPSEILAAGKYGPLVPIGDAVSLSVSMLQMLETPVSRDILTQRAMYFSIDRAVSEYLDVLNYK